MSVGVYVCMILIPLPITSHYRDVVYITTIVRRSLIKKRPSIDEYITCIMYYEAVLSYAQLFLVRSHIQPVLNLRIHF